MADLCALCEQRMLPGQRRADTDKGKAHSSCASIADQHMGFDELVKITDLLDQLGADRVGAWLIDAVSDKPVRDAIRDATLDTFPSKSTQLRNLMIRAADWLDRLVKVEREAREYSRKLTPDIVAAMVNAATVLRTVAIYVSDDA